MTVPTHMTATALLGSRLWLTSLAALALCACSSESPSEEAPEEAVYTPADCSGVLFFPDPVLEDEVRTAAGVFGEPLRAEHVVGVTEMVSNEEGIRDLSGIECLSNLTFLDVRICLISDLAPVASLTSLERLLASDNQIRDLTWVQVHDFASRGLA